MADVNFDLSGRQDTWLKVTGSVGLVAGCLLGLSLDGWYSPRRLLAGHADSRPPRSLG